MERLPETDFPPSMQAGLAPNYLGSPAAVEGIIEDYLTEIVEWVQQRSTGAMEAEEMTALAHERASEFSITFAGEDPRYSPVVGWNTRVGGLAATIQADLGHYWQSQREAHGDDPYRVLYAWLVWAVVDAMKQPDPDMVDVTMADRIVQLVRLLTGSTKRKGV